MPKESCRIFKTKNHSTPAQNMIHNTNGKRYKYISFHPSQWGFQLKNKSGNINNWTVFQNSILIQNSYNHNNQNNMSYIQMTNKNLPTTLATYQSWQTNRMKSYLFQKASKPLICTMLWKHHSNRRVRIPIISKLHNNKYTQSIYHANGNSPKPCMLTQSITSQNQYIA